MTANGSDTDYQPGSEDDELARLDSKTDRWRCQRALLSALTACRRSQSRCSTHRPCMRLVAHTARASIGIRALASSSLYDVAPFPTVDAAQACVAAFRHAGFLTFPNPNWLRLRTARSGPGPRRSRRSAGDGREDAPGMYGFRLALNQIRSLRHNRHWLRRRPHNRRQRSGLAFRRSDQPRRRWPDWITFSSNSRPGRRNLLPNSPGRTSREL